LPQVTTDGKGSWVAVWQSSDSLGGTIGFENDILVARSTDDGATWSAPAALNTNATSDSGHDSFPQLTTDGGGSWVAVWTSADSLGGTIGTDRDILVARSTDDGASWTAPAALNTNATSDSGGDSWPQVTTDGAGSWVAVWTSGDSLGGTIGTDGDILVARSTDDGASWTAPAAPNTNATSDSGGDSYPQVTVDGTGSWVAVWSSRDSLGGTISTDDDILVTRH
jgi:SH3-like domain-containing protein